MHSPKQITLRNPSPELCRRLKAMAMGRGQSLNSTVLNLLEQAVGVDNRQLRLERYATWNDQDYQEFSRAQKLQRVVDETLWK